MSNKLAIGIPVYNNVALLKQCLQSIENQNCKDFSVHIFDDHSTLDYISLIEKFPSLNLTYSRNENNLGALANMQFAYNSLKDKYGFIMIMHEDDLLHEDFVAEINQLISTESPPAFIISRYLGFSDESLVKESVINSSGEQKIVRLDKRKLCMSFIKIENLAFGSVVYNTRIIGNMVLDFKQYAEFADTPFLLNSLSNDNDVALLSNPMYYYRFHGIPDNRWRNLRSSHIFNVLISYKKILVDSGFLSARLFKKYSTGYLFGSYSNLLLTKKAPSFLFYLILAGSKNLLSVKYSLLRISVINKLGTTIKRFFF